MSSYTAIEQKLSSDDVPQKFVDWLLSMGCPADKIASVEKVAQMCRGQYYMVWRSMMEHVEPKDVVRQKRLQVFCDDVRKCQTSKPHDSSVLVPAELSVWRKHQELQERVKDAEARVSELQEKLTLTMDKVSNKLAQQRLAKRGVEDAKRRVWLLQTVAEELRNKRGDLLQAKSIADSHCCVDADADVKNKLDKCISMLTKPVISPKGNSTLLTSTASHSSIGSTSGDSLEYCEEHLSTLARCTADEVFSLLYERRASLVQALSTEAIRAHSRTSPNLRNVLAHNTALHCNLSLNAMKHPLKIKRIKARLANTLNDSNTPLSNEACELLVLRCERARVESRVNTLKALIKELTARKGIFLTGVVDPAARQVNGRSVASVDKIIIAKKTEIKNLLSSMVKTERKIQNVRDSLNAIFKKFQADLEDCNKYRGIQLDLPEETIAKVRQFYKSRQGRRAVTELSLNLDTSGTSCNSATENASEPSFVDELKIYSKKFNLENNRKLVFESGEKIWIFETLDASLRRLHMALLSDDVSCSLVCPSVCLSDSLRALADGVLRREEWRSFVERLEGSGRELRFSVDITAYRDEEEKQTNEIKKRLSENIKILQKSYKSLEHSKENLRLWSESLVRKHLSSNRRVDGKTYSDYEAIYLRALNPVI